MDNKFLIYGLIVLVAFGVLYVTSDEFKGVKLYPVEYSTYSDNGISFQYPTDWNISLNPESINYPDEKLESMVTLTKSGSGNQDLKFSVFLVNESVTKTQFQNYLDLQKTLSADIISQRDLTIDGVEAYEVVERIGDGQQATITFMKDGKEFQIRLCVPNGLYPKDKNIETIREELNTILSSFKITNSTDITLDKYLKQK